MWPATEAARRWLVLQGGSLLLKKQFHGWGARTRPATAAAKRLLELSLADATTSGSSSGPVFAPKSAFAPTTQVFRPENAAPKSTLPTLPLFVWKGAGVIVLHSGFGARCCQGGGKALQCKKFSGIKSSFSIALMCTTSRRMPASASTNQGPETGDVVLL